MFLLHAVVPTDPYALVLVSALLVGATVAIVGLLVALLGFLAVVDRGRGRLGLGILREARRPTPRRWMAAFVVCAVAAALSGLDVLIAPTWLVLVPGLLLGDAIVGASLATQLTVAAVVAAAYWVLAFTGVPILLRQVKEALRRRVDHPRHA
jgi:hypothetical protein